MSVLFGTYAPLGGGYTDSGVAGVTMFDTSTMLGNGISYLEQASPDGHGLVTGTEFRDQGTLTNYASDNGWTMSAGKAYDVRFSQLFDLTGGFYNSSSVINWTGLTVTISITYST